MQVLKKTCKHIVNESIERKGVTHIWQQDINTRWVCFTLSYRPPVATKFSVMERQVIFQRKNSKEIFLRMPQYSHFELGNLIYSSKTGSEFELRVQARARKSSFQYKSLIGHCQQRRSTFVCASGRDKSLAAEQFVSFCGQKSNKKEIKVEKSMFLF